MASSAAEDVRGKAASGIVRLIAHCAVVTPFVVSTVVLIRRGWMAEGDEAVITARAFEVFSAHSPLVGQLTWLRRPAISDLGPLEYWLITVPVHLDPLDGALWGAALMCGLAATLAVAACWYAAGPRGALTAALVTLGNLCWMPSIVDSPVWNPHFGEMWFLAAIACCFAVLRGHMGFLPFLMLAASVSMQCHLMFAFAGAGLCLLGLGIGLVTVRRSGHGAKCWLTAVGLGIMCWAAPLVQQLTARSGNLGALLSNSHTHYHLSLALQALTRATVPPVIWLGLASTHSDYLNGLLTRAALGPAVVTLAVSALMVPTAARLKSRLWLALAAINLVLLLNVVLYVGDIPSSVPARSSLYYLISPFLVTGVVAWLTVLTGLAVCWRHARGRLGASLRGATVAFWRPLPWVTAAVVGLGGATALVLVEQSNTLSGMGFANMKLVATACDAIEHHVVVGPVQIAIESRTVDAPQPVWSSDMQGLASCLTTSGYSPELPRRLAQPLGTQYEQRSGVPLATFEGENPPASRVTACTGMVGRERNAVKCSANVTTVNSVHLVLIVSTSSRGVSPRCRITDPSPAPQCPRRDVVRVLVINSKHVA